MVLIQKEIKKVYLGNTLVWASPIDTPGIYHNSELGLISLSSNGSDWITIADKNLGATIVCNYRDTLTDNNCGYGFQWGNNYGFPHSGTVTISTTTVSAAGYGPGNYYNSSTFIAVEGSWDRSGNNNLWGATTGTVEAMQGPCNSGFHVPTTTEFTNLCNILFTTLGLKRNAVSMWKYLKMPMAGIRSDYSGTMIAVGSDGRYWDANGRMLYIYSSSVNNNQPENKARGDSVRPFKNEAVQPDASRTKLY